ATEVYGIEISLEDAMDGGSILHRRSRPGRQAPVAVEFELQSTTLIGIDSGSAEASMQTVEHRQLEPRTGLRLGGILDRRFGENVQTRLRAACRDRSQPACQMLVFQQFPHVAGRGLVAFPGALASIDVQRIASSGHGDVEQSPLLLFVKGLVVGLSQGISITQFRRKSDKRFL